MKKVMIVGCFLISNVVVCFESAKEKQVGLTRRDRLIQEQVALARRELAIQFQRQQRELEIEKNIEELEKMGKKANVFCGKLLCVLLMFNAIYCYCVGTPVSTKIIQ